MRLSSKWLKHWKIVAEKSILMADSFEKLVNIASRDVSKVVHKELQAHQAKIITSVQQILGSFLTESQDDVCE